MAPIYLDNAATTPVRPEVRAAMEPFLSNTFGNPASAHRFGQAARAACEQARRTIAGAFGVHPDAVVFTSGGTEADNLAIIGRALAARADGGPFRVAVSSIEHKAVLGAAHAVEHLGGEAIFLPVDATGAVEMGAVDEALAKGVAVLAVMWVNNEVGVIQDVAALAERCAAADTPLHVDAVQAVGKVACMPGSLAIPLMAISGHKIGAPKGVGALLCLDHDLVEPMLHGGGQQDGVRPGTENVCGAVALAEAVELAIAEQEAAARHTRTLRDELERRVREAVPDVRVNPPTGSRAPHVSNLSFPGTDAESLLMHFDQAGIACSGGSACSTGSLGPSHVLTALGVPPDIAIGSVRFSFAKRNTMAEVERVASVVPDVVDNVRKLTETLGG